MPAYLTSMPAGVAGDITKATETIVESGVFTSTTALIPTAFGVPVKLVSGKFQTIAASDTASVFAGVLSRHVPSIAGDTVETFEGGTPNPKSVQGIVVRGYVNVKCTVGTPVRGGTVFMRVTESGVKKVGDFETAADSGACVALSNVTWAVSGKDANNVTEIRIF
jgi:hypothetical protein